jgi:hypothetical protein
VGAGQKGIAVGLSTPDDLPPVRREKYKQSERNSKVLVKVKNFYVHNQQETNPEISENGIAWQPFHLKNSKTG